MRQPNKKLKHIRRGMYVMFTDGSIEKVTAVFRFPANTKYRKKGRVIFQSKSWIWHDAYSKDVRILGFQKQ